MWRYTALSLSVSLITVYAHNTWSVHQGPAQIREEHRRGSRVAGFCQLGSGGRKGGEVQQEGQDIEAYVGGHTWLTVLK